jgi:hypothetical protein
MAGLYVHPLSEPLLIVDDFQILVRSWTWSSMRASLWLPHNEHVMPVGQLWTWMLVQLTGRLSVFPWTAILQSLLAVVAGMWLLYHFVRREVGQPFPALVAMVLFGVTTVYQQAVYWFSSSFSILALDTTLVALLGAQSWRQTGRRLDLVSSALAAALAPAWFASGILAGPLCTLYLLPIFGPNPGLRARLQRGVAALVPLIGTLAFLIALVSVPRVADQIMHLEHYAGKTAVQAFHPLLGLHHTWRSVVDNLALGVIGIYGIHVPVPYLNRAWMVLAAISAWWWWRSEHRRLLLLGLGFIALGYWLVYSARAEWPYDDTMNQPGWSRYHLLPQLGLALFVCAGLTSRSAEAAAAPCLSTGQMLAVMGLIATLFLLQLPRGLLGYWSSAAGPNPSYSLDNPAGWPASLRAHWHNPLFDEQQRVLKRIEAVDARCREYQIDAAAARAVLPWLEIPGCDRRTNGWNFLRGSDNPWPRSPEEVRRLLEDGTPNGP